MTTTQATPEETREKTLKLAERLARRERFSADWIHYPIWAGSTPDMAPYLKKAEKFREDARAILKGELPPPEWLAEEDPAFRKPEPEANPEQKAMPEPATPPAIKHRRTRIVPRPPVASWKLRTHSPPPRRLPPQGEPRGCTPRSPPVTEALRI